MSDKPPVIIVVKIKGSDSTFRQKFLEYDIPSCHHHDEIIKKCIDEAREAYKGEIENIDVQCNF